MKLKSLVFAFAIFNAFLLNQNFTMAEDSTVSDMVEIGVYEGRLNLPMDEFDPFIEGQIRVLRADSRRPELIDIDLDIEFQSSSPRGKVFKRTVKYTNQDVLSFEKIGPRLFLELSFKDWGPAWLVVHTITKRVTLREHKYILASQNYSYWSYHHEKTAVSKIEPWSSCNELIIKNNGRE